MSWEQFCDWWFYRTSPEAEHCGTTGSQYSAPRGQKHTVDTRRQKRWRDKNKARLAQYQREWRAKQKAG